LITTSEERIGKNGIEEIKSHRFFNGVDWNNLRNRRAPFIPEIKNEIDVANFDKFDENEPFYPVTN
jgi:hypothetical protein